MNKQWQVMIGCLVALVAASSQAEIEAGFAADQEPVQAIRADLVPEPPVEGQMSQSDGPAQQEAQGQVLTHSPDTAPAPLESQTLSEEGLPREPEAGSEAGVDTGVTAEADQLVPVESDLAPHTMPAEDGALLSAPLPEEGDVDVPLVEAPVAESDAESMAAMSEVDQAAFAQAVQALLGPGQGAEPVASSALELHWAKRIAEVYQAHGNLPLWRPAAISALSRALDALVLDGLSAETYRFEPILFFLEDPALQPEDVAEWALVDVVLTEALLRALYNLEYGKVDPEQLDADFNYPKKRKPGPDSAQLLAWIKQGAMADAFAQAQPQHDQYQRLRAALIEHYQHSEDERWLHIPDGRTLKPGMRDGRVPILRQRLGVRLRHDQDELQYDKDLEGAVRAFQEERNLDVDGILGPMTLAALNITLDQRIDQIRLNLERHRWFDPDADPEYLVVDVAGFRLSWIRAGEVIWQERVQVGKPATKTPIFRDEMRFLEFNPSWSIPPGINRRVTLPSLRLDPGYLDKKGYQLLTDQGKPVDPYSVDWHAINRIPYIVRQPPGPNNALGRVKFMFPNKHHVFLHDTNQRNLFSREVRTTSSGCIRLQDPFDFAERLLGPQGWDRSRIDQVVAGRRTTRVDLERPLPIYIRYLTAEATDAGVNFRNDIYQRDAKLLAKLDGPFQLHLAELPQQQQVAIRARLRSASEAKNLPAEPEVIGVPEPVVQQVPEAQQERPASKWKTSFIDL